jgi:hypothetical protein
MSKYLLFLLAVSAFGQGQVGGVQQPAGTGGSLGPIPNNTVLGNNSGSTAVASALTTANLTSLLLVGPTSSSAISINGGTAEAAKVAIQLTAANESAFAVANCSVSPCIDPYFHINANGIGLVGNSTYYPPFLSIERDAGLSRELRLDMQTTYVGVSAKSTNHSTTPNDLFLRADNNIYFQAGTSNSTTDNTASVNIGGSAGINFGPWPSGAGWMSINSSGSVVTGTSKASAFLPGIIYSAAGTALPSCASGIKGEQAVVSDATSPTYMGTYASGGGITAAVICSYNGTTYSWLTH